MADNQAVLHEKEQSLNFLSASFDPLKALYTKDLKPPIPSIQVFNNLGEYARVIKEGKAKNVARKEPRKTPLANKRTRNLKPEYKPPDISTRLKAIASTKVAQDNLLSSEKRVGFSRRDDDGLSKDWKETTLGFGRGQTRKKKYMNVLEKMDACATGPLSILYKCLDKRYKVQVWIRKYKGLRSVLTGYVIAFDKHMNLALMDVDEVYTTEEYHKEECSGEEKTAKKKKKKKKKKKRKTKSQIDKNLIDTDNEENISVGINPPLGNIHEKSVTDSKENSTPPTNESTIIEKSVTELKEISIPSSIDSTTAQNVEAGLTQVVDLNRPFKSLKLNYNRQQTVFKSNEEARELTIMKDEETSSSLLAPKEYDKTEMLSADQLALLSRQWANEQEQESKQDSDSHQETETIYSTMPSGDVNSEQTGYLFSHDLKVRVPAHEDMESQDVEFTVVGIFQPASTVGSSKDKSVMLPDNLEFNVPISFPSSIDKNEKKKDHTEKKLDKPVIPVTELVSDDVDEANEMNAHSLQAYNPVLPVLEPCNLDDQLIQLDKPVTELVSHDVDEANEMNAQTLQAYNPVLPVSEPCNSDDQIIQLDKPEVAVSEPGLHNIDMQGNSEDQAMQLDKPVSEPVLHSIDMDGNSEDQVLQLDKPEVLVSEPVLYCLDSDGDLGDQDMQLNKPVSTVSEPVLHSIDMDGNSEDQVLQQDKPEVLVSEPCLYNIDIQGNSEDQAVQLDKPVSEPVLHSIDMDGNSEDKVLQQDKPEVLVSEPCLYNIDIQGNSEDQAMQLDKPVSEPVLHSIDRDGDLGDQDTLLDKPVLPVSELVLHSIYTDVDSEEEARKLDKSEVLVLESVLCCKDVDEEAKNKTVQSDNVVTLTEESLLNIIDLDGNATQHDEKLSAEARITDEKSLICEGSSKERESSHVCNFSDDITDKLNTESLSAPSCGIDENSIIFEKNTKETEMSQDISTLNSENCNIESLAAGSCISNEKEIEREQLLKELDVHAESEEKEKTICLQLGSKSPEQNKTEGNHMENEDVKKAKEKCFTSKENKNNEKDNEIRFAEGESEKIGDMNQGIDYINIEESELIEPNVSSPRSELSKMMALKEQNKANNELAALSGEGDSAVKESGAQDKPCKGEFNGSTREQEERSKHQTSSGESKTVEESGDKGPGGPEDQPQKHENNDFHKGLQESNPPESLSSVNKNDATRNDADGLPTEKESMTGEPMQEEPSEDGRTKLDGKNKGNEETEKSTQPSEGLRREGANEGVRKAEGEYVKKGADEDKAMESEKEEGELTSSDEEEPVQRIKPQVNTPKHAEPKKLSVWERLGFKGRDKNEESERMGSRENYEKKRRDEKKREPRRSKVDEKKAKDLRRSMSEEDKRKEESVGKKEGKEKRDLEKEKRRGSVGSGKETRRDKDTGTKRRERQSTRFGERVLVTGSDPQLRRDKEKKDERKKNKQGAITSHAAMDEAGKLSHDTDRIKQSWKDKEGEMDGKSRDRRSSVREEKNGQSKEGRRRPSNVVSSERLSDKEERNEKGGKGEMDGKSRDRRSSVREEKNGQSKEGRRRPSNVVSSQRLSDKEERNEKGGKGEMDGKSRERRSSVREEKDGQSKEGRRRPSNVVSSQRLSDKEERNEKGGKGEMDGKSRERRSSVREEKDGQSKQGRRPSRVMSKDDATAQRSDKEEKRSREKEKEPILSSTEIKGKQKESLCDGEKRDGIKEQAKSDVKKEERKERTVKPQGDHDSERGSRNTRHDVQAGREHAEKKEKKAATRTRKSEEPQGDQPKQTCSSDAKQLVLKEVSSNLNKAKDIPKGEKNGEISKPEHRLTEQKRHRKPKGEGSEGSKGKTAKTKTSDQPQGAQRRKEDRLSVERNKYTKVDKTREAQLEKSSRGSESRKEEPGKGAEEIDVNTSERTSTGEHMNLLKNPKTEKTDIKPVKVGLLPTPVLEIRSRTSGTKMLPGNSHRNIRRGTTGARNLSNESSKMNRNEKKAQSSETCKKRRLSIESGTGGKVKRQKRTEISEKNSSKSIDQLEQFKDTRKDKGKAEPEVKATRETAGSESRSSKIDMGGEGRNAMCTAHRIEVGKGKYLEFKRRHVNQLFVRGDNIVMIGYAI